MSTALVKYDAQQHRAPGLFRRLLWALAPGRAARSAASELHSILIKDGWGQGEQVLGDYQPAEYADVFERNPWVFACVNAIATDLSGLAVKILDGKKETIPHPWQGKHAVFYQPNEWQGFDELLKLLVYDALLAGDCYLYNSGEELLRLPAMHTRAVPDKEQRVSAYLFEVNGKRRLYQADEVMHVSMPSPTRAVKGMSQLAPLRDTLSKEGAQVKYERNLWQNNARVSGILETEIELDQAQRDMLLREWTAKYAGVANSGKTALLSHGLKYQRVALDPTESGYHQSRSENREEILAVFGVPPVRVGLQDQKFANAKEQMGMYWRSTISPYAKLFGDAISRSYYAHDVYWVELDVKSSEHYAASMSTLYETAARSAGWRQIITQNEARAMIGLPPHPDPEADEVNKAPMELFPALSNAADRLPNIDALEETSDAESGGQKKHLCLPPPDARRLQMLRAILVRSTEARRGRHLKHLQREYEIAIKEVATPVLDRLEAANMQALAAAERSRSEQFRATGRLVELRAAPPELPDPERFEDELVRDLHAYLLGCFERVGNAELDSLIAQKRAMRYVMQTRDEGENPFGDDDAENIIEPAFDISNPRVLEEIAGREIEIKTVPHTVQEQLRRMVAEMLEKGATLKDLREAMQERFVALRRYEADRIARTEAGSGTNAATHEAMDQAGSTRKQWIHSGNPMGRPGHIANASQGDVPFEGKFSNGMRYPMESGFPPGEVINCQCVLVTTSFD